MKEKEGIEQKLKDKGTFISVSMLEMRKKPSYSQNLLPVMLRTRDRDPAMGGENVLEKKKG